VQSFDPDVDDPYVDPEDSVAISLDADLTEVDEQRALDLLDAVTSDLPGGGESRDEQRDMVRAVAAAITRRRSLVVEAGTGVGKSLAYLVPLALAGRRVVVSTATKNLQDQLAGKDAPLVAAHAPGLRVSVLKGRANYVCRLRVSQVAGSGQLSLDDDDEIPASLSNQMRRVLDWSNETNSGDRDELSFEVDSRIWRQLSVTPQECLGRVQCPMGSNCFTESARDRAASSDVVIVNTHLYAAHLAGGQGLLPEHDLVVFDEAHEVLDIFAQSLGTSLNAARFRALGTLARSVLSGDDREAARETSEFAERFSSALDLQYDSGVTTGLGEQVTSQLDEATRLVTRLADLLRSRSSEPGADDLRRQRALAPAQQLLSDLSRLRSVNPDELLWLTRRDREVDLELSLVDVGPRLRQELWPAVTAVLTSATVPETLMGSLGLEGLADELRVASPFDYPNHALLYVPEHLPTRNDDGAESAIADELVDLITAAGGRTLALFTNRAVMKRVADAVSARVLTPVLVQDTLSRARLIERFRDEAEASLFAVTSYWQGVDVPGHSLSLVTIDRLPFSRPDDPLSQARRERAGERAFYEVDVPRAAMLLAQGVGRLIRSSTDRGVVAVLDTRLATAGYRSRLLNRLPPMRRTRTKDEVLNFLREIDSHGDLSPEL
jgi:ATP-dependent DNA helicase DinG